eukprot:CCRYP_006207-RA/>CCRYP_006207-RA protein AED:0.02 eAED:0.02 QI:351/1/1/1/0.6/0.5/6/2440/802
MSEEIDLTLSDDEDVNYPPIQTPSVFKDEETHPTRTLEAVNQVTQQSVSEPRLSAHSATASGSLASTVRNLHTDGELKRTRVDGKGMWNSWTRNFRTHTLALLDLIDNALDASIQAPGEVSDNFIGRVHILPDIFERDERPKLTTTGITIVNNSWKPIRSLAQVLEVYNSSKLDAGSGDIGENGIGLKQGCAALSDLSFILVKNGDDSRCELGIVAEQLQRVESVYLPAFDFPNSNDAPTTLKQQMLRLFSQPQHDDVARCVAQYGAALHGSNPSLAVGIDRLCNHFHKICKDFYSNSYVFSVIIDKPRENLEDRSGGAADALTKIRVTKLLKSLHKEIPVTYLHLPKSFDFRIEGQDALTFHYWQSRLVELSATTVNICKTIGWHQNLESEYEHPDSYKLRLFLGFDRVRITDPSLKKAAALYVYSRQSGRLVKYEADARHLLGLTSGGSTFSSGLTILVDDIEGNLPLNPTKQDIAFGEDLSGETHSENLFRMIGATTSWYYNHHLSKFDLKKEILTSKISQFDGESPEFKSFDVSQFTTYSLVFKKHGKDSLRVDKKSFAETLGCDTIWRLEQYGQKTASPRSSKRKRESRGGDSGAFKPSDVKGVEPKSPPPRKRSRPVRPDYYEGDDFESDDESEDGKEENPLPAQAVSPKKSSTCQKRSTKRNIGDNLSDLASAAVVNNEAGVIHLCGSSDEDEESTASFQHEGPTKSFVKEEMTSTEKNGAYSCNNATVHVEIDEMKKEIELEKQKNDQFKKEINELKKANGELKVSLSTKIRRIETLENENNNLRRILDQLRKG